VDHKLKKKLILARNKRNQRIFQNARDHKAEHERILDAEQAMLNPEREEKTREKREEEDKVWTEKTQQIRNKLTKKKHAANERWNRFAATGDAGGRGR
jgi:hypothetical protein